MTSERWDIELDASYIASGQVSLTRAQVAEDFSLEFRRANGEPQDSLEVETTDLAELTVDRHGLDAVALRLGGSWNVLPGSLQVSGGGFYQSRGVKPDFASIDNYGFGRVGFGLGVRVRLGPVDLTASYAHIFQETLDIAPPAHEPREEATDDPKSGFDQRIYEDGELSERPLRDPAAPSASEADGVASVRQAAVFESEDVRARVINAGRYVASFNIVSLAVTHQF